VATLVIEEDCPLPGERKEGGGGQEARKRESEKLSH